MPEDIDDELEEFEEDNESPGWDAIDQALLPLYGDQKPKQYASELPIWLGGDDPLPGISAYRRETPVPHWHYVTYGLSDLFEKESDDEEWSG